MLTETEMHTSGSGIDQLLSGRTLNAVLRIYLRLVPQGFPATSMPPGRPVTVGSPDPGLIAGGGLGGGGGEGLKAITSLSRWVLPRSALGTFRSLPHLGKFMTSPG